MKAIKAMLIWLATKSKNKSVIKRRVMTLYVNGFITAGDVERLFMLHNLAGA